MSKRSRIWQAWFLAGVLALGFGIAWAIAVAWSSNMFFSRRSDSKRVKLLPDQTLAVERNQRYGPNIYETLDGRPIKPPKDFPDSIFTTRYVEPPGLWNPLTWRDRLARFLNSDHWPTEVWYLVYDGKLAGSGYFVGYDLGNRRCLGYLGRNGYQRVAPAPADCFPIDGTRELEGVFAGSGAWYGEYSFLSYRHVRNYSTRGPCYVVYLLSGNRLLRINLVERSIRVLRESEGMTSIAGVGNPMRRLPKKSPQRAAFGNTMLALRTTTDVIFLDSAGKEIRRWAIPESLRSRPFAFYPMGETTAIAEAQHRSSRKPSERYDFVWFDSQGTIQRTESATLPTARSWTDSPWFIGSAFPVPAFFGSGSIFFTANSYVKSGDCPDWPSALAAAAADQWPPNVAVVLLSVPLAVVCYRRQRRYNQPWTWVWVVTVLLFGLPGLIGYLFHRRWPPIEPCPSCEKAAPRDREACYACGQTFPRPTMKGTEVFA